MKTLLVSATAFEVQPTIDKYFKQNIPNHYSADQVDLIISGIGMLESGIQLANHLMHHPYKEIIQVGVAGAFDKQLELGSIVEVISEQYGDLGAEEVNGHLLTVSQLGLPLPRIFKNDQITVSKRFNQLRSVRGITVNQVSGSRPTIVNRVQLFHSEVESMEGLAAFRMQSLFQTPVAQVRAISNRVEERNKDNWALNLAIENLNAFIQHEFFD